jgi:hypothetical protein
VKITKVSYGELRSLPGMNHVKITKEAEVEDGDDPDACLERLRIEVGRDLGDQKNIRDLIAAGQRRAA